MHAGIQQLLTLRDGRPLEAAMAQHVQHCAHCTRELQRLSSQAMQLRSLPALEAPAAAWPRIQHALREPGRSSRSALAAGVVLAVLAGFALTLAVLQRKGSEAPLTVQVPEDGEQIAQLMDESQRLEALLHALPDRPVIERVSTAATIEVIEGRISWLDHRLSYTPQEALSEEQSERLWRERVELMDSLIKVRYAEAGASSF